MRTDWPSLFVDLLIGALVMVAISVGAFALDIAMVFAGAGLGAFGLLWPAILLGPVVVFLGGLAKRRPGLVLSPILVTVLPVLGLIAAEWFSLLQIRMQDQPNLTAPRQAHDTIILASEPYTSGCDTVCIELLARTPYQVAVPDWGNKPYGPGVVFHKAEGETCYGAEGIKLLVRFASRRLVGTCAVGTPFAQRYDGLVFRQEPARAALTLAFRPLVTGNTFSVIERSGGQDRLLGRWTSGKVDGLFTLETGPEFRQRDLYGRVLGLPFDDGRSLGQARRTEVIAWLRPAMRGPAVPPPLLNYYVLLLDWYVREHPDDAKPLVDELIASQDPERHKAGIALLPENLGLPKLPPEEPVSQ